MVPLCEFNLSNPEQLKGFRHRDAAKLTQQKKERERGTQIKGCNQWVIIEWRVIGIQFEEDFSKRHESHIHGDNSRGSEIDWFESI